jgi:hypothetical protein
VDLPVSKCAFKWVNNVCRYVMVSVREHRTTRATKMNPSAKAAAARGGAAGAAAAHGGSSRSHCALQCTLRQVDRSSRDVRVTSFTCMDLAGAERPSSNGDDHADALTAIMQFWRDPSKVKSCEQVGLALFTVILQSKHQILTTASMGQ